MRINYMFVYCLKSIFHRHDRIFALLNIGSVAVTILIVIALAGLLYSFKVYSENILNQFPLRIEIFKTDNVFSNDLAGIEREIVSLSGVAHCFKRVPTAIPFRNADGVVIQTSPRGSTILPAEPLDLKDIYGDTVKLLSNEEIHSHFDEVGIIISFDFLKKLGYFPENALPKKRETWKGRTPPKSIIINLLECRKENPQESAVPIPVIGIVADLPRDDYIITEDFYNIILCWQHAFTYILRDRNGRVLVKPESKITKAYYVLNEAEAAWAEQNWDTEGRFLVMIPKESKEANIEMMWLDEHRELETKYQNLMKIQVLYQDWDDGTSYEQRLIIMPISRPTLSETQIQLVEKKLKAITPLASLKNLQRDEERIVVQDWKDFAPVSYKHQYIQAAVYARARKHILPLMESLTNMGLYASSPLKDYLNTFDRQERFFTTAAKAIFILILTLAAIVLFSTFYASVQRKRKQIGILKACGAPQRLIRRLYYLESALVIFLGMACGIFMGLKSGVLMTSWISKFVQLTEQQMVFILPWNYIGIISLIVFFFCWLAIFIPAQIAASTDPAQVVRN